MNRVGLYCNVIARLTKNTGESSNGKERGDCIKTLSQYKYRSKEK